MEQKIQMDVFKKNWGWIFVFGVALIILGAMAMGSPVATTLAIEVLLGWIFVIAGVAQALSLFSSWRKSGVVLSLLGAILFFVIGTLLLSRPMQGALTLTMLLIAYFLASGIGKMVAAIRFKELSNWGWLFFNGIVSLFLAILIWRHWPSSARWVVGLLVGIELFFSGMVMTIISLTIRKGIQKK